MYCIGKNLAATLNYDLLMLTFFDLPQFNYQSLSLSQVDTSYFERNIKKVFVLISKEL
jgi:hypothetical protein